MISLTLPTNFVAIDTETNGLYVWRGHKPFAACGVFNSGRIVFWRDDFKGLKEICADENLHKVFFNAKFDCEMLAMIGCPVKGRVWDVRIFAHLLDGRQALNLDSVSRRYLPQEPPKVVAEIDDWMRANKIKKADKGANFKNLPPDLLKRRCIGDTSLTIKLFHRLYPVVAKTFPLLMEQEHRLIPIVSRMERRGFLIDLEEVHEQRMYLETVIEHVQQYCAGIMDNDFFNLNSPKQQRELAAKAGFIDQITIKTKKTKQPSMNAEALRGLHHPVAAMLLLGKMASQLSGTFLSQIQEHEVDSVVHAGLDSCGTLSGRFSSSKPNLLNIPAEGGHLTKEELQEQVDFTGIDLAPHIKKVFKVRPGFAHIHADKSKLEVAMLAHYTNDKVLCGILSDPSNDIHAEISQLMFESTDKGLRVRSKAVVFGYIYGAGDEVIARRVHGSISDAKEYRRKLEMLCPTIPRFKSQLATQIRDRGYIETVQGRRHYLYPGESYMAINRMCQGTGADEVKSRLPAIEEELISQYPELCPLLNIHDDIVSEVPLEQVEEILPKYKEVMERTALKYNIPLPVSVGVTTTSWADLTEIAFEDGKPVWPEGFKDANNIP